MNLIFNVLLPTILFQSCALFSLRNSGDCDSFDVKTEGQDVYGCSVNFGKGEWRRDFTCENDDYKPTFKDTEVAGTPAKDSTCSDTDGNIWVAKSYRASIFCTEEHKDKWLHITGWSYSVTKDPKFSEMNNKYYFKCDPQINYPDPVSGTGSGAKVDYIKCAMDEKVEEMDGSPKCSKSE